VITDYKGKKFLGWKAEKTLLGSILTEKLKNMPPSCRNKGTHINAKFEPLVGKTHYEIGIYEKLVTSIIHTSRTTQSTRSLSFCRSNLAPTCNL
jgi:hypothetical protein